MSKSTNTALEHLINIEEVIMSRPSYQEASTALQHLINIADAELSRDEPINPFMKLVDKEQFHKEVAEQCNIVIEAIGGHVSDFYADIIPLEEYDE